MKKVYKRTINILYIISILGVVAYPLFIIANWFEYEKFSSPFAKYGLPIVLIFYLIMSMLRKRVK